MTPVRTSKVTAYHCKCNRCDWEWTAYGQLPERCAGCKKVGWNAKPGTVKRGRPKGKGGAR